MNRIYILSFIVLVSCGERKTKTDETNQSTTKTQPKTIALIENKEIDAALGLDRLQDLFPFFNKTEIVIEVGIEDQNTMFSDDECIPLKYQSSFNNILPQTSVTTTGAKPIGKIQLDPVMFLLVLVQQDDYGPIYYGAKYDVETDKVLSSEIIGQIWEDAGHSQIIKSTLTIFTDSLVITKKITICHAELEVQDQEMVAISEECNDSTAIIKILKMDL